MARVFSDESIRWLTNVLNDKNLKKEFDAYRSDPAGYKGPLKKEFKQHFKATKPAEADAKFKQFKQDRQDFEYEQMERGRESGGSEPSAQDYMEEGFNSAPGIGGDEPERTERSESLVERVMSSFPREWDIDKEEEFIRLIEDMTKAGMIDEYTGMEKEPDPKNKNLQWEILSEKYNNWPDKRYQPQKDKIDKVRKEIAQTQNMVEYLEKEYNQRTVLAFLNNPGDVDPVLRQEYNKWQMAGLLPSVSEINKIKSENGSYTIKDLNILKKEKQLQVSNYNQYKMKDPEIVAEFFKDEEKFKEEHPELYKEFRANKKALYESNKEYVKARNYVDKLATNERYRLQVCKMAGISPEKMETLIKSGRGNAEIMKEIEQLKADAKQRSKDAIKSWIKNGTSKWFNKNIKKPAKKITKKVYGVFTNNIITRSLAALDMKVTNIIRDIKGKAIDKVTQHVRDV